MHPERRKSPNCVFKCTIPDGKVNPCRNRPVIVYDKRRLGPAPVFQTRFFRVTTLHKKFTPSPSTPPAPPPPHPQISSGASMPDSIRITDQPQALLQLAHLASPFCSKD